VVEHKTTSVRAAKLDSAVIAIIVARMAIRKYIVGPRLDTKVNIQSDTRQLVRFRVGVVLRNAYHLVVA
jgi:hypothetical protein